MLKTEILQNLRAIVDKRGKLNAKEREFITGLCAENGIQLNTLCPDCYKDAAVELYSLLSKDEPKRGAFALREGVDIMLNKTERVCEATCTDENARKWLAMGLPVSYFVTMPDDASIE